ncbi:MAG: hypothetical protein M1832_004747 [Thelocarpon impressellum]|nr:MAG: hypothetical protein M1832_004747 [Thelocarpon impressellum]
MADGMNHQRALRIASLMSDFRTLHHGIAALNNVRADDSSAHGFQLLRRCVADAQAVLQASFFDVAQTSPRGVGDEEREKAELQRVLIDACTRRFEAQKIYLRAAAAYRWTQYRAGVLRGQKAQAAHLPALQSTDDFLRTELARVTDECVYAQLGAGDAQAGHWTAEDPPLELIRQWALTIK